METTIWCSGLRVSGFTITRGPFRGATITRIIFWSKSVASPATAGRRTEGPTPNCKLYWVAVKELNLSSCLGDALSFTVHIYIYTYPVWVCVYIYMYIYICMYMYTPSLASAAIPSRLTCCHPRSSCWHSWGNLHMKQTRVSKQWQKSWAPKPIETTEASLRDVCGKTCWHS